MDNSGSKRTTLAIGSGSRSFFLTIRTTFAIRRKAFAGPSKASASIRWDQGSTLGRFIVAEDFWFRTFGKKIDVIGFALSFRPHAR